MFRSALDFPFFLADLMGLLSPWITPYFPGTGFQNFPGDVKRLNNNAPFFQSFVICLIYSENLHINPVCTYMYTYPRSCLQAARIDVRNPPSAESYTRRSGRERERERERNRIRSKGWVFAGVIPHRRSWISFAEDSDKRPSTSLPLAAFSLSRRLSSLSLPSMAEARPVFVAPPLA